LEVVLSNSRGPQTLSGLVDQLGKRATAATVEEAARAGDWVVLSIPFGAYQRIPVEPLAGKTVLETTNYFDPIDQLAGGTATSSELVQRHLAGAHVVKAFNTILARHLYALARPAGSPDRSALPIAGDPAAKAKAAQLLDTLGWDSVDAGSLAQSWRLQSGTPAFLTRNWPTPTPISPPASPPTRAAPAPVEKIRAVLAAANR
jgi:8-hydroxy-5-deazaflavin:NADPH oxidoreductase